jgi:recombination protein RecA
MATTPALFLRASGVVALDAVIGGGYPYGRLIEIFGPEKSGKSTLALRAAAACQADGGTVLLVDLDQSFAPEHAASCGADSERLLIAQPDTAAQGFDVVDSVLKSRAADLIIVDSADRLLREEHGERVLTAYVRRLAGKTAGCTILFVGSGRGNALRFFCSIRLQLEKAESGRQIRVVKNKFAAPFQTVPFETS